MRLCGVQPAGQSSPVEEPGGEYLWLAAPALLAVDVIQDPHQLPPVLVTVAQVGGHLGAGAGCGSVIGKGQGFTISRCKVVLVSRYQGVNVPAACPTQSQ